MLASAHSSVPAAPPHNYLGFTKAVFLYTTNRVLAFHGTIQFVMPSLPFFGRLAFLVRRRHLFLLICIQNYASAEKGTSESAFDRNCTPTLDELRRKLNLVEPYAKQNLIFEMPTSLARQYLHGFSGTNN